MAAKKKRSLGSKRRALILSRDGYRCQYCGITAADGAILEVDHKVPRARGGSDRMTNLITACRECNRSKRDKPLGIPPVKRPDRYILNSDGSVTTVRPKGMSSLELAQSLCGISGDCLSCGEVAMNRVAWTSPFLIARENRNRSFIYPICDDCGRRLFKEGDTSVGDVIDEKLIPQAKASRHVRLIESFDISGESDT